MTTLDGPVILYMVGTAGCGKSVLTGAFSQWAVSSGFDAIAVNLDPGAEELAYNPDIDIREWIKLDDVQAEYGLGPNGAQVLCADLLALNISDIKKEIDKIDTDYVVIDTPGQIELFAFRESSRVLTETLGSDRGIISFLFDSALAKQPSGLVSLMMLCSTLQFRFRLPSFSLLSKADLLSDEECERIVGWSSDPDSLMAVLEAEGRGELANTKKDIVEDGTITADGSIGSSHFRPHLSLEFFRAMESLGTYQTLLPVSAEMQSGLEDIYNILQQSFSGGDDPDAR